MAETKINHNRVWWGRVTVPLFGAVFFLETGNWFPVKQYQEMCLFPNVLVNSHQLCSELAEASERSV